MYGYENTETTSDESVPFPLFPTFVLASVFAFLIAVGMLAAHVH